MLTGTMFGLVLLPFAALLPAMIARSKGRSFLAWYVYGLLLWIIAIVHSLLLRPTPESMRVLAVRDGKKRCPACAEWVQGDARVCRYCGADVSGVTAPRRDVAAGQY